MVALLQKSLIFLFAVGDILTKILLQEMPEILLPVFSKIFMVLWLTFKSFIHFEFFLCMV